jgi:predicted PurR-regulated permease PerM
MQNINSNKLRQVSFFILLIFLGTYLFLQLNNFLPAFLGAITLYILMRRPLDYLTVTKKWHNASASLLLMLLSFILVLLPIIVLVNVLYSKINFAVQHSNEVLTAAKSFVDTLQQKYNIEIISDNNLQQAGSSIANILPQILGATFNTLATIVIMYFILYFLLTNKKQLEGWLFKHTPLKDENTILIGSELNKLVLSNALGIPITALLQGIIGSIAYWILGVSDLPFWFVVTCITAMVPMVGSALAFVSVAILLAAGGHEAKGIMMLCYGVGVMATLDSVFRIAIQKRMGNVHPLVTTFGVMVGVKIFGFIGLVFGPILLSMFFLLVKIYLNEFEEERS